MGFGVGEGLATKQKQHRNWTQDVHNGQAPQIIQGSQSIHLSVAAM
jgi:hypothetical protein